VEIPTDIKDQREVVKLLQNRNSKVNAIFYELTHQLTLVKKLRQQLLQDAVQGKLVEQNPKDEPASELLKKIKAERLNRDAALARPKKEKELPPIKPEEIPFEIPENWVWCRLGEICNYGSSPKAEPKSLTDDTWVLDLEDIEKETSSLICKIRFKERNSLSTKSKFKQGEVLYSKLRPYLDKVIVADEDGVCTTEILPLKLYGDLNPFYIRFTLKRIDFLKYVSSVTKGMKMPRLGTTDGQMALIPLPPLSEQNRIVQKLDELMQYCNELETSIKESEAQNEKLLQQVLREALRPATLNAGKEPVGV
jgi:type I restriction enzyme S subunit